MLTVEERFVTEGSRRLASTTSLRIDFVATPALTPPATAQGFLVHPKPLMNFSCLKPQFYENLMDDTANLDGSSGLRR
jgi:hypothetical protein